MLGAVALMLYLHISRERLHFVNSDSSKYNFSFLNNISGHANMYEGLCQRMASTRKVATEWLL